MLALSYGGTLRLRGAKGATTTPAEIETLLKSPDTTSQADENVLTDSGASWRRLAGGGAKDSADLTLDRSVADNWKDGDEVVVTTTDFFPNHSELRQLKDNSSDTKVTLRAGLTYAHADKVYDIRTKVGAKDESDQPKVGDAKERESAFRTAIAERDGNEKFLQTAETRAAVALLTRSIRIVSEGDKPGDTLKDATDGREEDTTTKRPAVVADPHYQYGGQVIFRQGFQAAPDPGRGIQAARPGRLPRPLSGALPYRAPGALGHLRHRLIGQRVDDTLVRHPLHPRRHPRPQRRLQVHRPRLLPGRRDRDRQQAVLEPRRLRARPGCRQ